MDVCMFVREFNNETDSSFASIQVLHVIIIGGEQPAKKT